MNQECTCNAPLHDWFGYHHAGATLETKRTHCYGMEHAPSCPMRMTFQEYIGEGNEYDEDTGQIKAKPI